jgi:hypothetical protein
MLLDDGTWKFKTSGVLPGVWVRQLRNETGFGSETYYCLVLVSSPDCESEKCGFECDR